MRMTYNSWDKGHRSLSEPELYQELSGTPNPWYFLKSIAGTNGRRSAVQMGGVLQYKLEVYCSVSLSPKLSSQRGTALQMRGVLRYKLEMYRQYFSDKLFGLGAPKLREKLKGNN